MALRVRYDVGMSTTDDESWIPDLPPITRTDYDRVLYECPECKRVHYVALECPPANAATEYYRAWNDKVYERVIESAD